MTHQIQKVIHSFYRKITINVIDTAIVTFYYMYSTEQIKCSKTKKTFGTTASRKPLFHETNQKHTLKQKLKPTQLSVRPSVIWGSYFFLYFRGNSRYLYRHAKYTKRPRI